MKIKLSKISNEIIEIDTNDIIEYKAWSNFAWLIRFKNAEEILVTDSLADVMNYIWSLGRESGIKDCTKKLRELNKRFENETECNDSKRGS